MENVKNPGVRNYSFLNKKEEAMDTVEKINGKEFLIPATPGTTYWAILRFFYENNDIYICSEKAIMGIKDILEDRDPDKWDKFKNKNEITTFKEGKIIVKKATHWKTRLENNIKTLTRTGGRNKYGLRLTERGHILQWNSEALINGGYILRTDTDQPINKKIKRIL